MYVNPEFRRSTVFVYYRGKKGMTAAGTAFITREVIGGTEWGWFHIVTARHILERARALAVSEDEVYLRVNLEANGGADLIQVGLSKWIFHPDDSPAMGKEWLEYSDSLRYDVAVMPCPDAIFERAYFTILDLSPDSIVTPELIVEDGIGPGDDVALAGLYRNHVGKQSNIPVIRSGIISAMPEEPVWTELGPMEAYLIEIRSLGGLSGSPVMWLSGPGRLDTKSGVMRYGDYCFFLLGLVHGHFDAPKSDRFVSEAWPYPERMNEGMSMVVPVAKILETVNQEAVMGDKRKHEAKIRDEEGSAKMDSLPEPDLDERFSLAPLDPETVLRKLLNTPPAEDDS